MRSPRSVQTIRSGIGTENGLLSRQTQYVIPATEFRLLTGHQPVQLGNGASALGLDWFKSAMGVPRVEKPEPSEPRSTCFEGYDQLREQEDDCLVVASRVSASVGE